MNYIGMMIVICFFILFYIVAVFFLDRSNSNENKINNDNNISYDNKDYHNEINVINNLYKDVKILYDVVNSQFRVDQNNIIVIGEVTYKKITNFGDIMNNVFTDNGQVKYVNDLGNYFAYTDEGYYLASNLVNYQTYYFRGDNTNIYVIDASDSEINGIIYERWNNNNKNTLATIRVVLENGKWLVDDITILSIE